MLLLASSSRVVVRLHVCHLISAVITAGVLLAILAALQLHVVSRICISARHLLLRGASLRVSAALLLNAVNVRLTLRVDTVVVAVALALRPPGLQAGALLHLILHLVHLRPAILSSHRVRPLWLGLRLLLLVVCHVIWLVLRGPALCRVRPSGLQLLLRPCLHGAAPLVLFLLRRAIGAVLAVLVLVVVAPQLLVNDLRVGPSLAHLRREAGCRVLVRAQVQPTAGARALQNACARAVCCQTLRFRHQVCASAL